MTMSEIDGVAPVRRKLGALANQRHEIFAHGLARGLTGREAFLEAGYRKNDGNTSRLANNEKVVRRVNELKELVARMRNLSTHKIVLTEQWVIEQLIGVCLDARSLDRPDGASANKALHLLGLQMGMFIEKKEYGHAGEFDGLTIAAKRERIMDLAKQLGLGAVSGGERMIGISRAKLQQLIDDGKSE
jgi:hypothetical protein